MSNKANGTWIVNQETTNNNSYSQTVIWNHWGRY